MGTLSQAMDYMRRKPEDFYPGMQQDLYTHFSVTPSMKKLRRKKQWYIEQTNGVKPLQLTLDLI